MTSSSERWQRLEALFNAALDLPADQRPGFVDREAGADTDLRSELLGMLAHEEGAASRIASAVQSHAEALVDDTSAGRRIGPYRVVRELGRGGMGVVFEAARADDEYQKTVALKVVPWFRDTPEWRERFRLERQILATLEHPHIARFLDGGTDGGTPYFAMELVHGAPITTYCQSHDLALTARLRLFMRVCDAVHFAHEHLVVHRDIKPTNVLVDETGAAKLLDFGIAKFIDTTGHTSVTHTGALAPMTLDYSAPEQVLGRPVTIRTDVYALGLLLYELVADARAQVVDASSPAATERSVCVDVPALPSLRRGATGDRSGSRALQGDIDTIVMTAIDKDPERRYRSVAALRDDLDRYLQGLPILARPATAAYRAARFVQRHKIAAGVVTAMVALAAAGLASTLYQARRAERRFQEVRSLANAFVFDVHDRIEGLPGATEARKAIVQTALSYLQNLQAESANDADLARELAAAYEKVGRVQGDPLGQNLGDPSGARESLSRARGLLAPLVARRDAQAGRQLVSVLTVSGRLMSSLGHNSESASDLAAARELGERLRTQSPDDDALLGALGELYLDLTRAASQRDLASAAEAAERAVDVAQRRVARHPGEAWRHNDLASAQSVLAGVRRAAGQFEQSAELFRRAIAAREQLVAAEPNRVEYRRNLLVGYGSLADLLGGASGESLGDDAGALAALTKSLEHAEWMQRSDPADRRAIADVANARLRLGTLLTDQRGQESRAIAELQAADALIQGLLRDTPASESLGYLATVIQRRLGQALAAHGDIDAARAALDRAQTDVVRYLKGANAVAARQVLVGTATAHAQLMLTRGQSTADALRYADVAAAGLDEGRPGTKVAEARLWHDLGRVLVVLATRASPETSARLVERARRALERAREYWLDPSVSPVMASRRDAAVADITAWLARLPNAPAVPTSRR